MRSLVTLSFAFILIPSLAWSGTCRDDSRSFRQVSTAILPAGEANEVEIVGNLAYLAAGGGGLQVWDISDPEFPVMLGSVLGGGFYSRKLEVSGDYVFVADRSMGLVVYDVSDPFDPAFVVQKFVANGPRDLVLSGTHLFFVDTSHGLWVFDVSDPRDPRIVANQVTPGEAMGIEIKEDVVYIADGTAGLTIYDVSDPLVPTLLSRSPWVGETEYIEIIGDLVLTDKVGTGLAMVDASDPSHPRLVGTIDRREYCVSAEWVNGNLLLVCSGGLLALDMTLPSSPAVLYKYDKQTDIRPWEFSESSRTDAHILVSDKGLGIRIYSIGNGFGAKHERAFTIPSGIADVGLGSGYCYVVGNNGMLYVVDISEVHQPVARGTLQVGQSREMVVHNNFLYLCQNYSGFAVVDVSDPAAPVLLGHETTAGNCAAMAVDGAVALVENYIQGVVTYDVSDPSNPVFLGQLGIPGCGGETILDDNLGFVGSSGGLVVVDVSDPSHPVMQGIVTELIGQRPLALHGEFLLTTGYREGSSSDFHMVDYSDPMNPTVRFDARLGVSEIVSDGTFVYGAKGLFGGSIIDLSNPSCPIERHALSSDLNIMNVAFGGDHFCMTNANRVFLSRRLCNPAGGTDTTDDGGILVKPALPKSMVGRLSSFPNPSNPTTTVRFALAGPASVTLQVFDLAGRLVHTLRNEETLLGGAHEAIWDGRDWSGRPVPSGVYLVHLKTDTFEEALRITHLK